jgi:hypothetical protein
MAYMRFSGRLASSLRSHLQKFMRKVTGDAVDGSWKAQTMAGAQSGVHKDADHVEQGRKYAAQMLMIQSVMTKKNLVTYRLYGQEEFVSRYSDICLDAFSNSPVVDAPPSLEQTSEEQRRALDSVRYLQTLLLGVPDLQAPSGHHNPLSTIVNPSTIPPLSSSTKAEHKANLGDVIQAS